MGWAGLEAVAKTNHWPDSWQCMSGGCREQGLTWPNYSVYLRTDGLTTSIPQYHKWFSVREVAPIPS